MCSTGLRVRYTCLKEVQGPHSPVVALAFGYQNGLDEFSNAPHHSFTEKAKDAAAKHRKELLDKLRLYRAGATDNAVVMADLLSSA